MPGIYVLLIVAVLALAAYVLFFRWRDSRADKRRLAARPGPNTRTPPVEPAQSPERPDLSALEYHDSQRGGSGKR